jgi:hypothetical protein
MEWLETLDEVTYEQIGLVLNLGCLISCIVDLIGRKSVELAKGCVLSVGTKWPTLHRAYPVATVVALG